MRQVLFALVSAIQIGRENVGLSACPFRCEGFSGPTIYYLVVKIKDKWRHDCKIIFYL